MESNLHGSYRCVRSETGQLDRFASVALLISSSVGNDLKATVTVPTFEGDRVLRVRPEYLCSCSCCDFWVSVYVDGVNEHDGKDGCWARGLYSSGQAQGERLRRVAGEAMMGNLDISSH